MVKILVFGDAHGILYKIPKNIEHDLILCSGDFCGEGEKKSKLRKIILKSLKKVKDEEKIEYSKKDKKDIKKLSKESLKLGINVLKQLNKLKKKVITIPGNWDYDTIIDLSSKKTLKNPLQKFFKDFKSIRNIHLKSIKFKKYTIIGYGIYPYPENKKNFRYKDMSKIEKIKLIETYEKNKEKLSKLFIKAKEKNRKVIFLAHNMPYKTKLDKIIYPENPFHGKHAGSVIVKDLIKKFKPFLFIGGHFHEHGMKWQKVNKTWCYNAGYGKNAITLINLNKDFPNQEKIK